MTIKKPKPFPLKTSELLKKEHAHLEALLRIRLELQADKAVKMSEFNELITSAEKRLKKSLDEIGKIKDPNYLPLFKEVDTPEGPPGRIPGKKGKPR